jgi:hypothetical protein
MIEKTNATETSRTGKGGLLGSILLGTGGSGTLAYPKAEVIIVLLEVIEEF